MGGFFLDSIIRSIAKSVKNENRANQAAIWLIVDGRTSNFIFRNELGNRLRPLLVYSYEVGGETFYGSAVGALIQPERANRVTETVQDIKIVHVRYDPSDPGESRLLNQDNPKIPFEIDHSPY